MPRRLAGGSEQCDVQVELGDWVSWCLSVSPMVEFVDSWNLELAAAGYDRGC